VALQPPAVTSSGFDITSLVPAISVPDVPPYQLFVRHVMPTVGARA
jgi:hypothetical protein